jgi:hypothetical protein
VGRVIGNVGPLGLYDDSNELSGAQGPGGNSAQDEVARRASVTDIAVGRIPNPNPSYMYQPQGASAQQRVGSGQAFAMAGQPSGPPNLGPERGDGSFDMGSMAGALPNYRPPLQTFGSSQGQQRFPSSSTSPYLQQQAQQQQHQISQLSGQNVGNLSGYNPGFSSQYIPSYGHGQQGPSASLPYTQPPASLPTRSILPNPLQQNYPNAPYFPGQQQPTPSYLFYPGSFGAVAPSQSSFTG